MLANISAIHLTDHYFLAILNNRKKRLLYIFPTGTMSRCRPSHYVLPRSIWTHPTVKVHKIVPTISIFLHTTWYFIFIFCISLVADGPQRSRFQSYLLQRCHPACGREGSSHLSPGLALRFFIVMRVQHSHNSSPKS